MISIDKIKVGGFRNISNVEVETNDIISLLSVNSYGKSNFLNGVIFGISFIHAQNDLKSRLMDFEPYKPFNLKNLYQDFSFELELSYTKDKKISHLIYGYSFIWKKGEDDVPEITNEYLKVKDSQKFTSYITRDKNEAYYKSSPTAACSKKINIEKNELVINKIEAYDDLYYLDIIKSINNVIVYVDRHFNTSSLYDIRMLLKKDFSDYSLNDEANVPRILSKINKEYPDKFKLIVNTIKDIFPFIIDIKTIEYNINSDELGIENTSNNYVIADNVYFLVALEKNIAKTISFSCVSDGVRRVLLIFITLVLADINNYSLVGIEEPENSLNPKILQRFLIALSEFSKNTKVIITSHSPYLINYMEPKNIYLGLPNNDGLAMFSKIKEKSVNKLLTDADNMDMLVGDYLFDLMSGNEEDLNTMVKYVE